GKGEISSEQTPLLFVVQTDCDNSGFWTSWRWFQIGIPYEVGQPMLRVSVDHEDGGGAEVCRDSFLVGPRTPALSLDSRSVHDGTPLKVVISPYVLFHSGTGYRADVITFSRDVTLERQMKLSLSELASIKQVQCRVTVSNN